MKICDKRCKQCLFGENRIVSKKRMGEIVKECRSNDSYFICHKHSIEGNDVMCRGYYETQPAPQMLRIAERLKMVTFVPTPSKPILWKPKP